MRYLFFLLSFFHLEAVHYSLTCDPIDVVIPCHVKDLPLLDMCIDGIRQNGENIGNVYVISKERLTDKAEWVDESIFPFTKSMVSERIFGDERVSKLFLKIGQEKSGWVYQQLLKLYAFQVLPFLSSNVLILDADTLFLNPVSFLSPEGNPLINYSNKEMSDSYFNYIKRFLPDVKKKIQGGVTHHMLFQRPVIEDLFSVVKAPFWEVFCDCCNFIPIKKKTRAPSEYDIYLYFITSRSEQAVLRQLKWGETSDPAKVPDYREKGYHYVTIHSYLRTLKGVL